MQKNNQQIVFFGVKVVIFFVFAFLFFKLFGGVPLSVNSTNTEKTAFSVTGEGKATAVPDAAVVRVGVTAEGDTVTEAQDALNKNINMVIEAEKAIGIPAEDIKTENYNVTPTYDFSGGIQEITGYSATSNISIKVIDSTKVNQVVDTATANGANQVGGVSFEVSDPSEAQDEARQLAVEDAKKKAQEAASAAGFTLGKIINYAESSGAGSYPMPLSAARAEDAKLANPTDIQPGTNEIQIIVTLSYEIL